MKKMILILKVINTIIIVISGFIFLMVFGFIIQALFSGVLFFVMLIAYIGAVIFGLLAWKKNVFLWFSMVCWMILIGGNIIDQNNVKNKKQINCLELRKDKACLEEKDGTMKCTDGTYPFICHDENDDSGAYIKIIK